MLQYDLTETRLMEMDALGFPTEAETFVLTVALLLIHEAPLSALRDSDLVFRANDLEELAVCLEGPLAALAPDFGQRLRDRLADFVGLRISNVSLCGAGSARAPR